MTTVIRRPRLLFLAPVLPADQGNGLAMRAGFFLQAYARAFDIDLAVFPLVSGAEASAKFAQKYVARLMIFTHPGVDSHFQLVRAVEEPNARLAAFRRFGRPSLAAFMVEAARRALNGWTDGTHYDVVHVSRLYLAELALQRPRAGQARLVIDCDEDDTNAYRRIATIERVEGRDQQAAWAEAESDAFARLAREILPRFDLTFVASPLDAKSLTASTQHVETIPNVAPRGPRVWRRSPAACKTILFVGSMGYSANKDAARWMATRVWPRLRRIFTGSLRLIIAGSHPGTSLVRLGRRRGIEVTGTVSDIGRLYAAADVAIVPIRFGGGTRIKLLEAAVWRVPIVSTTIGAEGTSFRRGRDLLIADNAERFAQSCNILLRRPTYGKGLAQRACMRINQEYSADHWARQVVSRVAALGA